MRGAQLGAILHHEGYRIIPAYAESTNLGLSSKVILEDHPRVCGEHREKRLVIVFLQGSSPRMRGAQIPPVGLAVAHGIIPAYAGSTNMPSMIRI